MTEVEHLVQLTIGHLNRQAREAERRGQRERAQAMRDAARILRDDAQRLPVLRDPNYLPIRQRKVSTAGTPSNAGKDGDKNATAGCLTLVVLLIAAFLLLVWGIAQSIPTGGSLTP
jgi:hypothetical protein